MDRDARARLIDAYRRERLSFLQYVAQAEPYAPPTHRALLSKIQSMAQAEAALLDRIAAYLDEQRIRLPSLGAFPIHFTHWNFVDVRRLLPELIRQQEQECQVLERDVAALPLGPARSLLDAVLAAKREHLVQLRNLSS